MREGHTEVLVVGAGPIGLWTALQLADGDVEVTIVDRESRTAARSYACALHGNSLKMLQRFGLVTPLLEKGRRIDKLAFYDGEQRRGQIHLSKSGGEFPFVLIVPQNVLEDELEKRLRASGVSVSWNHRFDDYVEEEGQIVATIEELSGTGTGYIVPHWESVVKRRTPLRTEFLIGTDGHASLVRQRLRAEWQHIGKPDVFAAYEFECEEAGEDEIRVVLDAGTTNVLWPLPNNRLRWTFQLVRSERAGELPEKERRSVRLDQPQIDEQIRQYVQRVAAHRAPWFRANVRKIDWCSEVVFEHRVVNNFGRGRCWLAGDAAHQTGPVGVHSMNMGFIEGQKLASELNGILKDKTPVEALQAYDKEQQNVWRQLLGLTGGLRSQAGTDPWLNEHRSQILSCLPGLGPDLASLAGQLGFAMPPPATAMVSASHG